MNQKVKNILGLVFAIVAVALGYAALHYVDFYGKSIQPSSFRSFSVTGDGKATAVPDIAEFSFQIIVEGNTDVASLQVKNTEAANKAITFIKSKGVENKDIQTQYYNIEPRYQTYDCQTKPIIMIAPDVRSSAGTSASAQVCPPSSIVGYTVTQSINVKMRDFKKIGDIMSGVVENGANQVGSLSFTIDDASKVQDEARAKAIAKAKAKAEAMASAGGFRMGRLLNIQEGGYTPYATYKSYDSSARTLGMTESAAPSPSIEPGSQDVTVNVTLQYEID
jgi:hypothetical protein